MSQVIEWNTFDLDDHTTNNDKEVWHYATNNALEDSYENPSLFWKYCRHLGILAIHENIIHSQCNVGMAVGRRELRSVDHENNLKRCKEAYAYIAQRNI